MSKSQLPKHYVPEEYEGRLYREWEESGFFNPDNLPGERSETFTIMLPPPNVTGTLHMGHAVMLAIEDAMTRFARMQGKKTLWLPGTDHAAIATESKVDKIIRKEEGISRHDLGREKFLERVAEFAQNSHDTIVGQMKRMGTSVDWSREAYTLDEDRNIAVRTAFTRMYEDGLIYRGDKVVNWDPVGQTTISDDELVYKEGTAKFYTFTYSKDFPIAISTTRPETKVGDTAVAVHPSDKRYKDYIGKEFNVEFTGASLTIRVIADEAVDPEFGTGALGVTPAHSVIDAEMAERHDLPMVQVIDETAHMTKEAGSLVEGLTTLEARKKIVEWLESEGLMQNVEEISQNLSTAERTGGVIEPLPKRQWFIDVNKEFAFKQSKRASIDGLKDGQMVTLKELMTHVVKTKQIKILPERFEKVYFHWIDNLRDWNISRQIWFGHRVPAWYKNDEIRVEVDAPNEDGWTQDDDTLDTWFSAGLWTFSTIGWPSYAKASEGLRPDITDQNHKYHPTSVLETGYDILFFWVARMILMTTYHLGEIPFETVYLHGLVRDGEGRKMSKSLDNIINPLDMIEKFGADATRLSLMIGATPGNDMKLSEEKIDGLRSFTNKLWNISRFIIDRSESVQKVDSVEPNTLADRWILSRFTKLVSSVTENYEAYEFSAAAESLRAFTWSEFADWYLEMAKSQDAETTNPILLYVLERLLKLWHPFMPFVTEAIWEQSFKDGNKDLLMISNWPSGGDFSDDPSEKDFELAKEMITAIRNIRAQYTVPPKDSLSVHIVTKDEPKIEELKNLIENLANVELQLISDSDKPENAARIAIGSIEIHIPLEGLIDADKERARLEKELEEKRIYIASLDQKLSNAEFTKKAPSHVVDTMRKNKEDAEHACETLQSELDRL